MKTFKTVIQYGGPLDFVTSQVFISRGQSVFIILIYTSCSGICSRIYARQKYQIMPVHPHTQYISSYNINVIMGQQNWPDSVVSDYVQYFMHRLNCLLFVKLRLGHIYQACIILRIIFTVMPRGDTCKVIPFRGSSQFTTILLSLVKCTGG